MKRLMLIVFSFICVFVFLYLGNTIYENKLENTVESKKVEEVNR